MVRVGNWMRNKETNEMVKVTSVGAYVEYANDEVDGEIRADLVDTTFDVYKDPNTQEEIEAVLGAMIKEGTAETGLYDFGISYAVVDTNGSEVTFQWFSHKHDFDDVLHTA